MLNINEVRQNVTKGNKKISKFQKFLNSIYNRFVQLCLGRDHQSFDSSYALQLYLQLLLRLQLCTTLEESSKTSIRFSLYAQFYNYILLASFADVHVIDLQVIWSCDCYNQ